MAANPPAILWNQSRSSVACRELHLADTPRTRLFGLLGRAGLAPGEGLLIEPSSGVHTFGMRFAIDVVALDARRQVTGVWEAVPPWRICALHLRTRSVLELGPGEARRAGIQPGDQLTLRPHPSADRNTRPGALG